jgi:hypothetical protein
VTRIHVSRAALFPGGETVMLLRCSLEFQAVTAIKRALAPVRPAAGWVSKHRCWWVATDRWPAVRDRLEKSGCKVKGV